MPYLEDPGFELEGGLDAAIILTNIRTSFRSGSTPELSWGETLNPGGSGFHGAVYWSPERDDNFFGARAGYFASSAQSYRKDSGRIFARETMDVHCVWASLDVKHYVHDWAYVKGGLGTFIYGVQTHLETNAVSYEYDGVSGLRGVGAVGLGVGLSTPWDFPLKASVEGDWWVISDQASALDAGVGQVSANLVLRF